MARHALKIYILGAQTGVSQYNVLNHFSIKFGEALRRQGAEVSFFNFMPEIDEKNPPDLTLSFFNLNGKISRKYQWEYLRIPHFYFSVDALDYFTEELTSDYFIASLRDRDSQKIAEEMGHKNTLFLPHAAPAEMIPDFSAPRLYDLVFLGTGISNKEGDEQLLAALPKMVHSTLYKAIDLYEADDYTSYYSAFIKACQEDKSLNSEILATLPLKEIFLTLDILIRGRQRLNLLKSIKNIPIHLFGNHLEGTSWEDLFKDQENIIIHPAVDFDEALKIMSQTKILLNTSAATKQAAHERIFYAYQAGALPITLQNPFLLETFTDEENILFYQTGKENEVEPKLKRFLENEELRLEAAKKGHKIVLDNHTWDIRAHTFLEWEPLRHFKRSFKN